MTMKNEERLLSLLKVQPGIMPEAFEAYQRAITTNEDADIKQTIFDKEKKVLYLHGVIVPDEALSKLQNWFGSSVGYISPSQVRAAISDAGKDDYTMEVNSPGGHIFSGADMQAALTGTPPVSVIVTGMAASMAAILTLVAEDRHASSELSMMMFHAPHGGISGNATEIEKFALTLRAFEKSFENLYQRVLPKKAVEELSASLMGGEDRYFTAQEAVDLGILMDIQIQKKTEPVENKIAVDGSIAKIGSMQFMAAQGLLEKYAKDV